MYNLQRSFRNTYVTICNIHRYAHPHVVHLYFSHVCVCVCVLYIYTHLYIYTYIIMYVYGMMYMYHICNIYTYNVYRCAQPHVIHLVCTFQVCGCIYIYIRYIFI